MKTKFTPGPWRFNSRGENIGEILLANTLGSPLVIQACRGYIDEEFKANAALIASAPEMYKTLELILNDCQDITSRGDQRTGIVLLIKSVLASARGEI